jgi:hypothetical protein
MGLVDTGGQQMYSPAMQCCRAVGSNETGVSRRVMEPFPLSPLSSGWCVACMIGQCLERLVAVWPRFHLPTPQYTITTCSVFVFVQTEATAMAEG